MGTTSPQSTTRLDLYTENDTNSIKQGAAGYGVLYGLTATAGTGLHVTISTGAACFGSTAVINTSTTDVAITAAHATNPRRDIIYMAPDGTISTLAGTASGASPLGSTKFKLLTPYPPEVPANMIILCEIYIAAAATSLASTDILDKRVLVNRTLFPSHIKSMGVGIDFYNDSGEVIAHLTDAGDLGIKGRVYSL